jgi:hypothetical protein
MPSLRRGAREPRDWLALDAKASDRPLTTQDLANIFAWRKTQTK